MSSATPMAEYAFDEDEVEIDVDVAQSNRRAATRITLAVTGKIELAGGAMVDVRSVDLSGSGIGVTSITELTPGQQCNVSIDMSVCGSDFKLEMKGRVCYSRKSPAGGYRSGLQFVQMTQETRAALGNLLH
jgi:c-di-GMP-binding flagellar brake protein YcgR